MKFEMVRKLVVTLELFTLSSFGAACGTSGVEGTYSNGGSVVLDIRAGGKADLTTLGEARTLHLESGLSKTDGDLQ